MITLSGSWRDFHFAQQRIHFSVIQLPACPHRSMTGHGCQYTGQPVLQRLAAAKLNQFLGDVAYKLGCPLASVTVGDTSTLEVPNSNGTGGSGGSEACVRSVLDACTKLNAALAPFREPTWQATVEAAAAASAPLHAMGWEAVTTAEQPKAFDYATQGVGCVEGW